MTAPYRWRRAGRSRSTAITVALVWLALGAAYVGLDASIWIIWLFVLFTLPALYDLAAGRTSEMHVTQDGLRWRSGRREDRATWDEIARIRLDTRLDLSVRTSLILPSGRRVRLPIDVTPPADAFEAALRAHGAEVRRHHFSLIG
ncbi:MAG: PH domain-containing protein [Pseudomonadota bacterium]